MKKVLSVLLSLCMSFAFMPITVNAAPDTEPPALDESSLSVTITDSKATATVGDTVRISAKFTDESIINNVIITVVKPDGNGISRGMGYDEESDRYYYDIEIDDGTQYGVWKIEQFYATDKHGNSKGYSNQEFYVGEVYDFSSINFTVEGTHPDLNAPALDFSTLKVDITDSKETATVGDKVRISAKFTDESIINNVIITIVKPDGNGMSRGMGYDDESDRYYYDVDVDDSTQSGVWKIEQFYATDKHGNSKGYSNQEFYTGEIYDFSSINFTVEGTNPDLNPPELDFSTLKTEIADGKAYATTGDKVRISAKFTDESIINSVVITVVKPDGNGISRGMSYDEDRETYYYDIDVDENTSAGIWKIEQLYATDKNGNSKGYSNQEFYTGDTYDFSALNFNVATDGWTDEIDVFVNGKKIDATKPVHLEKGSALFISFAADDRNTDHGLAPMVGFSDGYEGGTLSSAGFGAVSDVASSFGLDIDGDPMGSYVTARNLAPGTVGTLYYNTYKLNGEFSWETWNWATAEVAVSHSLNIIVDDHHWNAGVVTKKATPTATGVKTYTCTVCGEKKNVAIAKCAKYANTLTAKAKKPTVKYSKLKKKNQAIALKNAMTVSKAQGKVTYKKSSGNKKITVAKNGKITVKKGLKKGTYKVKIKVTAAGNATYKAATKTVTVTIKVK